MEISTKFSIQEHWQKRNNSTHFDLRVLYPRRNILMSWVFPKKKFPTGGEKIIAIRTPNHKPSYINFSGTLKRGDRISVYDKGVCKITAKTDSFITVHFNGRKIKGYYNFIKLAKSRKSWLVTKSKG